ncbi:hypothetical protein [Frankia sp. Cppng1_Ct_nod]|uniref:hypothetical protein n=1 Tax=Frankia sp. Cppng1_Ct_nod TaxID=2897162 RepID=UPI0010419F30|nr:hypothetical protein [Frankia sp. Cppng1_Ct_nod]
MTRRARLRAILPLALALPMAAVVAQPAQAAESCSAAHRPVTDYAGQRYEYRYYCSTYVGSPVYGNIDKSFTNPLDDSGYMYRSSRVWVVCQVKGRPNPVIQGNTNTWWLYTQGDASRPNAFGFKNGWGFLPATAVSQGGQNKSVPGVPVCLGRAPTSSIGSAPGGQQTFGSAPGGQQTFGSAPGGQQTFGSAP